MDGERTYMKFEKVVIKNFRNFDNVELDLSNKNIFFGLNDVGKTNFLYALRYVFDKDIRKQNLLDSDFHNKQLDKPIEIVVTTSFHVAFEADKYKHIAITFHSSKGLEFEQVIVFAEDYRLSDMSSIYNHYVAVTRAKSKLIIVKLNNYNANCFQNNLQKIFSESGHNIEDVVLF